MTPSALLNRVTNRLVHVRTRGPVDPLAGFALALGAKFIPPPSSSSGGSLRSVLKAHWNRFRQRFTYAVLHQQPPSGDGDVVARSPIPFHMATRVRRRDHELDAPALGTFQPLLDSVQAAFKRLAMSCSWRSVRRPNRVFGDSERLAIDHALSEPDRSIVLADKNMGFVFVDDSWIRDGINAQLCDTARYVAYVSPDQRSLAMGAYEKALAGFHGVWEKLRLYPTGDHRNRIFGQRIKSGVSSALSVRPLRVCSVKPLAKVHKSKFDASTLRLITQMHTSPFQPFCAWFAQLLQPAVVGLVPAYLRDSSHMICLLEDLIFPASHDYVIVSADANNMYGNLPRLHVVEALHSALVFLASKGVISEEAIDPLQRLALTVNDFCFVTFGGVLFRQIKGIAMGRSDGVQLAFLALGHREDVFRRRLNLDPELSAALVFHRRYIDDSFFLVRGSTSVARRIFDLYKEASGLEWQVEFIDFPATLDPSEAQKRAVPFLDLKIWRSGRRLVHDLFVKPSSLGLYIPPYSLHPPATHVGWITAELKRFAVRCSFEEDFYKHCARFFDALRVRGFAAAFIRRLFLANSYRDLKRAAISKAHSKMELLSFENLIRDFTPSYGDSVFLSIPFTPATSSVRWSRVLNQAYSEARESLFSLPVPPPNLRVRMAWSSLPNLAAMVDSAMKKSMSGKFSAQGQGPTGPTLTYTPALEANLVSVLSRHETAPGGRRLRRRQPGPLEPGQLRITDMWEKERR